MADAFSRTKRLIGTEAFDKLQNSSVAVFGIGGVGGYCAETLARSGIGKITLIDNDVVSLTNLNRQIVATVDTIGKKKTSVMKERILSINPNAQVTEINSFYLPETADNIPLDDFDFIIDAIDTVTAKLEIISRAVEKGIGVISCMGTGGKLDVSKVKVDYIERTTDCPLARVIRRELKKRGIEKVKVVYTTEKPITDIETDETTEKELKGNGVAPASMVFVPAVAGITLANECVKFLINKR